MPSNGADQTDASNPGTGENQFVDDKNKNLSKTRGAALYAAVASTVTALFSKMSSRGAKPIDAGNLDTGENQSVDDRNKDRQKTRGAALYAAIASTVTALFVVGERTEEIEKWFLPDACYFHDVATGSPDKSRTRPCLHGKPVYVQWNDNTHYRERPPNSYDIGNRVVTIESSDPGRPLFLARSRNHLNG